MASVRLANVSKVYGAKVRAVENCSLDIADGEFVVLVGPSGCGKSTTLRMIAGLEEVSAGTIQIGERDVTHSPPRDRDIAMVFQNYALYPHLNVRQNLSFGLERRRAYGSLIRALWDSPYRVMRRRETSDIQARVLAAAKTLGIDSMLDRPPRELSGGQRQRVAVGRALVRNPSVFLFDEPLSNLDALLRTQMRTELRILHRSLKATMVYVTHDQEEAMSLADRIVIMRDGVVQQIGTPREVYDRPANRFVAGFIGTPPMNLLDVTLTRVDGGTAHLRWQDRELAIDGSRWRRADLERAVSAPLTLGVRPDQLRVLPAGTPSVLSGHVASIERYGSLCDIVSEASGSRLVSRGAAVLADTTSEGRTVALSVEGSEAHLFDSSGAALPRSD